MILDKWALALYMTIIGNSPYSQYVLLMTSSNSVKKMQNFAESTVSTITTAIHSLLLQTPRIREAFPITLSLIIGALSSIGSHEYRFLMERSKLYSSTLITTFPSINILRSSTQYNDLINLVLSVAYLSGRDHPFLNQYLILLFTNCFTLWKLYFSPQYALVSLKLSLLLMVAPDTLYKFFCLFASIILCVQIFYPFDVIGIVRWI